MICEKSPILEVRGTGELLAVRGVISFCQPPRRRTCSAREADGMRGIQSRGEEGRVTAVSQPGVLIEKIYGEGKGLGSF